MELRGYGMVDDLAFAAERRANMGKRPKSSVRWDPFLEDTGGKKEEWGCDTGLWVAGLDRRVVE